MSTKEWLFWAAVAGFIGYLLYQKSKQTATQPPGVTTVPTSQLLINQNPDMPIAPVAVGTPADPATVGSGGILQSDPYSIWN